MSLPLKQLISVPHTFSSTFPNDWSIIKISYHSLKFFCYILFCLCLEIISLWIYFLPQEVNLPKICGKLNTIQEAIFGKYEQCWSCGMFSLTRKCLTCDMWAVTFVEVTIYYIEATVAFFVELYSPHLSQKRKCNNQI